LIWERGKILTNIGKAQMDDLVSNFYKLDGHSIEQYENSHKPRLDFLIEDLKLNEIVNRNVGDFGCGYAPIFRRMSHGNGNVHFGYDGDVSRAAEDVCRYTQCDLNRPIVSRNNAWDAQLDIAFCFETLEHLTNPYSCLSEIKRILKEDGILYLSIPHDSCTHNTIYPGLLYPVENFMEFLGQMALEIKDHRVHSKAFSQHVFTLVNKPWGHSKMKWYKGEEKFRNVSPAVAVNL
jgi:SAM-dependent methyltransferase